jgi:hypothetical protein
MRKVTLLNGTVCFSTEAVLASFILEHLRASDRFAFTEFVELCRSGDCRGKIKPIIRDVAISSTRGNGLDMELVHPILLSKPTPEQQIYSLGELNDLELDGVTILKITGRGLYAGDTVPQFVRLNIVTPNCYLLQSNAVQVDMEILANGVTALGSLSARHFEQGSLVFIAAPSEFEGRKFSGYHDGRQPTREDLTKQRAPRRLNSPASMYAHPSIAEPADYYRKMIYVPR